MACADFREVKQGTRTPTGAEGLPAASSVMVPALAMSVTVGNFLLTRDPHFEHLDREIEYASRERMVGVHIHIELSDLQHCNLA